MTDILTFCCKSTLLRRRAPIGQADYRQSNRPITRGTDVKANGAGFGSANHNGMLSSTYKFPGRFEADAACTCSTQHKNLNKRGERLRNASLSTNKRSHGNSWCHPFQIFPRSTLNAGRQRNNSWRIFSNHSRGQLLLSVSNQGREYVSTWYNKTDTTAIVSQTCFCGQQKATSVMPLTDFSLALQ